MNNETEWLESEKKRLTEINGLDPVEELLIQLGVCQHSNAEALRSLDDAFQIIAKLRKQNEPV